MILSLSISVNTISFGWFQAKKECLVTAGFIVLFQAAIIQICLVPTQHDVPSTILIFPSIFFIIGQCGFSIEAQMISFCSSDKDAY